MELVNLQVRLAEEIAIEFLQKNYSVIKVEKSVLKDDERTWLIEVLVLSHNEEKHMTVKVNSRTGMIQGYQ